MGDTFGLEKSKLGAILWLNLPRPDPSNIKELMLEKVTTEDNDRVWADNMEHVSCFLADLEENLPKDNKPREMQKIKGLHSPRSSKNLKYLKGRTGQTRWGGPRILKGPSSSPNKMWCL